jgi:hypothetical protein
MAREPLSKGGWFIEVSGGFYDLLVYSEVFLALRWVMLWRVPGADTVKRWPYLVVKFSQVGVMWMGHPIVCVVHHR